MAISIISSNKDPEPWVAALHEVDPSLDIQLGLNQSERDEVDFALCWGQLDGVLSDYPNLRCVCSMGAGVDHLIRDPYFKLERSQNVAVVRLVDPRLANDMYEYVAAAAMYSFRDFDQYQLQQRRGVWHQLPRRSMKETTIGIMGLGQIGGYVADRLSKIGFAVVGWSRSEKSLPNVTTYVGSKQLGEFLGQSNILVCMLPLTEWTYGVLNLDLFHALPPNASIINVARGEHLVEDDLLSALENQHIRTAFLDVFSHEPLVPEHPFWQHDRVHITPHCASITDPRSVAPQIVQNYRNMQEGRPLLHRVDRNRGY